MTKYKGIIHELNITDGAATGMDVETAEYKVTIETKYTKKNGQYTIKKSNVKFPEILNDVSPENKEEAESLLFDFIIELDRLTLEE